MTKTLAAGLSIAAAMYISVTAATTLEIPVVRQIIQSADTLSAKRQVLFNRYQVPVMTVFIAHADGTNERALVPSHGLEYSPSYSADGQWVVFTAESDGQADIYRIHPDGTRLEQLTDHPAFDDQGALSPDGRTLAFVSTRERGKADIWLLDLRARTYSNLTRHYSGNFRPSWSPDGDRLVFKPGQQLFVTSLADGELVPLTDTSYHSNFPQWSPAGEPIMFTTNRDGDYELYTIRSDGTQLRRLTDVPGNDAHSTWCADGEWIVFGSARMGFKDEMALYDSVPQPYGEIFAMRADGSDVRQLTDNKWEDSNAVCRPD